MQEIRDAEIASVADRDMGPPRNYELLRSAFSVRANTEEEFTDLSPYFHLTIKEVAKKFDISAPVLSRRIKATTKKWPFKELKRINHMLDILYLNTVLCDDHEERESIRIKIRELHRLREEVMRPIFVCCSRRRAKKR